ncbi:hypothetical protein N7492_000388 [Penicillium capsulatum]|uniref:Uncharacterized protein n=1 Tax=Penicillium capsulatum TaxID=69766 RepID=A0A9W9IRR8_9EURO|nr:hypothetical protein N7492_000388 [Penicillium capsulatum]
MTARTFRDPSPHRPSTSSGPSSSGHSGFTDVPPLPSLPSQYANRAAPRRAVSVDPSTRSPPSSPRTRRPNVDREREGAAGIQAGSHCRISSLNTVPETDRPASRSSVNFSYPMSSRPTSPALTENRPLSLGASAAREVLTAGTASSKQSTPEKPARTKPRAPDAGIVEGSAGRAAGARAGTAVAAAQAVSSPKPTPQSNPSPARDERQEHDPLTAVPDHPVDHALPVAITLPEIEHPSRVVPERWPATVPEEIEPEEGAEEAPRAFEADNRLASPSPTTDHVEAVSTPPQSPPPVEKETTPQQQAHLRQSSSPGRSARFAKWLSVTSAGDQVHQPPPRSLSPVKSALKNPRGNSLSPDRRAGIAGRGTLAPGEISDGTSVASDEGSRVGAKKRSVKVSFDDEAEIVGVAASPPTSPEEYVPDSPPGKSKSRMSWLGVGKKKQPVSEFATGNDDFDEVMKPRPALPSFGSVRGNREGGLSSAPIPQLSDNDSSTSSEDEAAVPGLSFSSDHAFGGLLSKPQPELSQVQNIKTVEQLSVNGDASVAQSDSAPDMKMDGAPVVGITEQPPYTSHEPGSLVPSIAVEPATPPVDNEKVSIDLNRSSMDQYQVPGGFPPSNSDRSLKTKANSTTQPAAGAVPQVEDMDTEGESDTSVYSDAAEDFDGDGFGSINAIVDSKSIPRSAPTSGTVSESRDTTPRPVDRVAIDDSQSRDATEPPLGDVRSTTPTQESVNRQAEESPTSPSQNRGFGGPYPPLPTKSKARYEAPHSASSKPRPMSVDARGLSDSQNPRQSNNPTATSNAKPRPVSLGPSFQRNGGPGFGVGLPSGLRRTKSNDSDSSSSFKRASPSTRGGGPRAMRRTMRSSPTQGWVQTYSDRTESPVEHRPLSAGSSTGTMRKTLRNSGPGNERLSFFTTNKKAQRARFTKSPPKPMQSSRFADSDDERDQSVPQPFQSRFADSSDEEEPGSNNMRPVRGIPRRQGAHDGDSTELDDSSAEEDRRRRSTPVAAAQPDPTPPGSRDQNVTGMSGMAAVARQRGMSQRELEQFLMQPPRGRKPSILNRLGLKKSKNSDHRIRKSDVESPSRRDTPLERSRVEREHVRNEPFVDGSLGTTVTTVSAASPSSPPSSKLLKKNTKRQPAAGESWPLRVGPRTETPEPVIEQSHSLPTSPLRTERPEAPVNHLGRNGSIVVNGENGAPAGKEPESPESAALGQF